MEYIIMFITHILKTAVYFGTAGFPEIPLEQLPTAVKAVIFNIIKLAEIYSSVF